MRKHLTDKTLISIFLFLFVTTGNAYPQQASSVSDPISNVGQSAGTVSTGVDQVDKSAALIQPDLNPYNITVPEKFGNIEEIFQGASNSPLIIHIQNVHANYEAQLNIKGILNELVEKHKFSLVQLEGAVSKLDPQILQPSYLKEANLKLVDFLMREGRITGADAFAVETDKPVELYGIEDQSLYMENLKMFKVIYRHQEELKPYFDEMHRLILDIGPKLFDPELLDFTRKTEEFSTDKIDILDYLVYMNILSEKHKLASLSDLTQMVDYPNLVRIMRLHKLEAELNKSGLQRETEAVKLEFQKKMPGDKKAEELLSRLDGSAKGINPRSYFLELTKLAEEAKIDFVGYPAFRIFAEFLIHQDEIDHQALFAELKKFEQFLQDTLFTKEDEKTLLQIIDFLSLLEQYFRLEMSREKIALYVSHRDEIKPSWIAAHLNDLAVKHAVAAKPAGDLVKLDSHMSEVEYFYQVVLKRDQVFVEKILERMKSLGQNKTILVTGGFHKDGLIDHFRKENISYVIVSPKVDIKEGNENYLKVMLEEEAVVGSVYAGTFAVENAYLTDNAVRTPQGNRVLLANAGAVSPLTLIVAKQPVEQFIREITRSVLTNVQNADSQFTAQVISADQPVKDRIGAVVLVGGVYDQNGKYRQFRSVARYDSQNGNFVVEFEEIPPTDKIRRQVKPPVKLSGAPSLLRENLPSLPSTVGLFEVPTGTIPIAQAVANSIFFGTTFVPVVKDVPPDIRAALAEVNPSDLGEVRQAFIKNPNVTAQEVKAIVTEALQEREDALPNSGRIASLNDATPETKNALGFLNKPKTGPTFLVLQLSSEGDVARAELRALGQVLRTNPGDTAAIVYSEEGAKDVAASVFGITSDQMREKPFKQLVFIENARGAKSTMDRDLITGGAIYNRLRSIPFAAGMTLEQMMKKLAVLVPSDEAGERLSRALSDRFPQIVQLADLATADDLAKGNLGRVIPVRFVAVKAVAEMSGAEAAALRRQLQEAGLDNVITWDGANRRWMITASAIDFIVSLYRFQQQIEQSV